MASGLHDGNNGGNGGQCFNPAFIHSIVVPDIDMLNKPDKICVVARGDGVVDVINIETELAAIKSQTSKPSQKGSQHRSKHKSSTTAAENPEQIGGRRLHLDYSLGGHTAAVSCVLVIYLNATLENLFLSLFFFSRKKTLLDYLTIPTIQGIFTIW